MSEHINRRDVLKAAGTASSIAFVNTISATPTDFGPVRLVEVGIEYDLADENPPDPYRRNHVDGCPVYFLDGGRMVLSGGISEDATSLIADNDVIVGTKTVNSPPTAVSDGGKTSSIPITTINRRRPVETLLLEESFRQPTVMVEAVDSQSTVVAGDDRLSLDPGTERTVRLSPRTVAARTFNVTDEKADIEGVPDHRLGLKTEYDQHEVEVQPVVTAADHGELSVVRVQNN